MKKSNEKLKNNDSGIIGLRGENKAAEYLENKGYRILERNFHSRFGEIDIIAEKDNIICFIEVKTRKKAANQKNKWYGSPAQAVNYSKQQKLIRTAECYLINNFSEDSCYRFDIIEAVHYNSYIFSINHLEGAFEL